MTELTQVRRKRLIIVTGMSGAGKTVVLNALEDLGFYCIDNLPINLFSEFLQQIKDDGGELYSRVAVGIDARNPADDLSRFPAMLLGIKDIGFELEQVYVGAAEDILIKRFSETRRRHPLSNAMDNLSLAEAISTERKLLEPMQDNSSLRIDTSYTNVHQLRKTVQDRIARRAAGSLSIKVLSFGFKHGVPADADFMFDVRCLPNPYWDTSLREFTGRDQAVIEFLEKTPIVVEVRGELEVFLDAWVPRYEADDRSYLTIAIGCTGGHHRSVYMVEKLAEYLIKQDKDVMAVHRDLSI